MNKFVDRSRKVRCSLNIGDEVYSVLVQQHCETIREVSPVQIVGHPPGNWEVRELAKNRGERSNFPEVLRGDEDRYR